MDNLTHSATGFFLGRTGLSRGVPHANWILLLAANAPDVDLVSGAGGALAYLNCHRHLTHAIPLAPLLALLPLLLVRVVSRRALPWGRAYLISLAGVGSHLALDFTNIYGVRLMLPFSARWFRLDQTGVVDLWIWSVCLLALVGPVLARLVNAEIGASRAAPGRGWAVFALLFLLFYNAGRGVLHERAEAVLDARLYDGAAPLRVAALPSAANPFLWRGLVETPDFYSLQEVNLLGEFDPAQGRRFYKPEAAPALSAAAGTRVFRDFLRFSQFPLWRVTPVWEPEPGTRVEAMDLRFGTPSAPAFVATAVVDARGEVRRAWFSFGEAAPR